MAGSEPASNDMGANTSSNDGDLGAGARLGKADTTAPAARPGIEFCRPLGGRLAIGQGHSALIVNDAGRLDGRATGFFHHQARFLSVAELRIADRRPSLASACTTSANHLIAYYVAPAPSTAASKDRSLEHRRPKPMLELQVDIQVTDECQLIYRLTNRGLTQAVAPLTWLFDADFADQGDVAGNARRYAGKRLRRWTSPSTLEILNGSRDLRHSTLIEFAGDAEFQYTNERISTELILAPQTEACIRVRCRPVFDPQYSGELPKRSDAANPHEWLDGCARIRSTNSVVQDAWDQAMDDLHSLQLGDGAGDERYVPAAGFPNYVALFGRDTLMAGWQTALLNPSTLRGSLSLVGRWTATAEEPERDAQPGRVLHQRELGPRALLGQSPYLRYYGDHSASALFLIGVAHTYARDGDRKRFLEWRAPALHVLDWMDRFGDADGDGLFEYRRTAKKGLKNQGWKDSAEAILYPDGGIVPNPIVICEVQALFSAAKASMAAAFRAAGETDLADRLGEEAEAARRRLIETMWWEEEGFLALGLDPQKRQIRTVASNAGECLAYGVLDAARARRVADRLMQPDLFSGWGVRTLSASHPAYNPLGYHIGSVWPCFTALTARGLARYGFTGHLHTLARAFFDATLLFDRQRLPELFGGHARDAEHPHPGIYPNACSPQAWSAGAAILLVDTLIGLKPAAPLGAAALEPSLPPWLPSISIHGVELGAGHLDLDLRVQPDGSTECHVLRNSSGLRIVGPGLPDGDIDPALRAFVDALP